MARWIAPTTRLAIYLRDGSACVYCRRDASVGALLTLDHVVPRNHGGGNKPHNLVTSCRSCNSSRKDTHIGEWLKTLERAMGSDHAATTRAKMEGRLRSLNPYRKLARSFMASLEGKYDDWGQAALATKGKAA